ncbi:unnamed protein product [Closterium sp. Yama58-4]|nr:unnamed protein product [Closterium sp. Yama58-4]
MLLAFCVMEGLCAGLCAPDASAPAGSSTLPNTDGQPLLPLSCLGVPMDAAMGLALLSVKASLGVMFTDWNVDVPCALAGQALVPGSWSSVVRDAATSKVLSLKPGDLLLRGSVNSLVSTLTSLTMLQVHNNFLFGSVPSSRTAFSALSELKIQSHYLTGSMPAGLPASLKYLDASSGRCRNHGPPLSVILLDPLHPANSTAWRAGGVCHVYVDKAANLKMAKQIVLDAKMDYPAACNAMETLLLHEELVKSGAAAELIQELKDNGVVLHAGKEAASAFSLPQAPTLHHEYGALECTVEIVPDIDAAIHHIHTHGSAPMGTLGRKEAAAAFSLPEAANLHHEYGALECTVEIVPDIDAAIHHIHTHGSAHTDAIVTEDKEAAKKFLASVDSAVVVHNASTRFSDGFRFGLGAEVGISTSRIHARGPVGVEGLLTTRWLLRGDGHLVNKDKEIVYTHKSLPLKDTTSHGCFRRLFLRRHSDESRGSVIRARNSPVEDLIRRLPSRQSRLSATCHRVVIAVNYKVRRLSKTVPSNHSTVLSLLSSPPLSHPHTPSSLYHYKACPFAQRVVIAVNYKGLDFIERVEISLRSKPEWYTEKVYPPGKVPAIEHDGKVVGESLDLLLLIDEWFGDKGPRIVPEDPALAAEASALVAACGDLMMAGYTALSQLYQTGGEKEVEAAMGSHLDSIEASLGKHQENGPFFLGSFSYVDIAYLPFLERFKIAFDHFCHTDITKGRPNLQRWFEAAASIKAYTDTCMEREATITTYQQMLDNKYFERAGVASSTPATTAAAPAET